VLTRATTTTSIEVVAGVEDNKVRLLARGAVAVTIEEEKSDQLTGNARSNSDFLCKRRNRLCKRVPMR
jgi:hypothetical protein